VCHVPKPLHQGQQIPAARGRTLFCTALLHEGGEQRLGRRDSRQPRQQRQNPAVHIRTQALAWQAEGSKIALAHAASGNSE
jgi:hypothetical protein